MSFPILVMSTFATVGAYVLLGTGILARTTWLVDVDNRSDISSGLYLYAWPTEKLFLWRVFAGEETLILEADPDASAVPEPAT